MVLDPVYANNVTILLIVIVWLTLLGYNNATLCKQILEVILKALNSSMSLINNHGIIIFKPVVTINLFPQNKYEVAKLKPKPKPKPDGNDKKND